MSQQQNNDMQQHFYRASAADFDKIPGSPVAYWVSKNMRKAFADGKPLGMIAKPKLGMRTGNNDRFIRIWTEVSIKKSGFGFSSALDAKKSGLKWLPYNKGGEFRRWYGNNDYLVNWENDGFEIKKSTLETYPELTWDNLGWKISNERDFFKPSLEWSRISSSYLGVRISTGGFLFDTNGSSAFPDENDLKFIIAFLCTPICSAFAKIINPSVAFQPGDLATLPIIGLTTPKLKQVIDINCTKIISISKDDWDSYEISWDFKRPLIIPAEYEQSLLAQGYRVSCVSKHQIVRNMKCLEEDNNRLFIDAYGLQDELTPEVPLSEITLTCNPHYRYGGNLTDAELEARLQSDTIAELISYAIGCMMGRYSLDREGLVYAHAGNEDFKALVEESAYATFAADDDGILPLTSENWFSDDVAARIEEFVSTVWGKEPLEENLKFIADSLCLYAVKPVKKGGETARETIRRYLSSQFYKDHLKTYKKRPIYWLFSSGKEKAFECLVYLHRYSESTLPRMRTEYVTPLLGQMASRIERKRMEQTEASTAEAKRIGKEIDSLTKQLSELRAFDDQLKHHADMRITLDLDDGVKVNYGKFGTLLSDVKAITGDKGE